MRLQKSSKSSAFRSIALSCVVFGLLSASAVDSVSAQRYGNRGGRSARTTIPVETNFEPSPAVKSAPASAPPAAAKPEISFSEYAPWLAASGLDLTDYHIHLRGGMTAEKAVERARLTGVRSGVLENAGRDWPLSSNAEIAKFLDGVEAVNATLPLEERVRVGIQVNDRDWFNKIDPKLYRRLDYILADTMIMGVDATGKPQKLWLLPKIYSADPDNWFQRYFNHCMTVVDEPIDILANPTYLPQFIADQYDKYWTKDKMRRLIQKAIDNDVALEIQAESEFPKPAFIEMALEMGAKLTFGSNNFDDKLKDTSAWKNAVDRFGVKNETLWRDSVTRRLARAPGFEPQAAEPTQNAQETETVVPTQETTATPEAAPENDAQTEESNAIDLDSVEADAIDFSPFPSL